MTSALAAPPAAINGGAECRPTPVETSDPAAILRVFPGTVAVRRAGGLVALAIGLAVIAAWVTGHGLATRLSPDWTAIQPNAGIVLVLLGLALQLGPTRVSAVPAALAGGIGGITLLEYLLDWKGGIDNLLIVSNFGVPPGRMAPNTALAVFVAGAVLSIRGLRAAAQVQLLASAGSVLAGFSFVEAAGHLTGLGGSYAWGSATAMPFGTAVALCAFGVGLMAAARISVYLRDPEPVPGAWLPVPLGVAALTVATTLWQGIVSTGAPTISVRSASWVFITLAVFLTAGSVLSLQMRESAQRALRRAERAEQALVAAALELENRAVLLERSVSELQRSNRELQDFAYVASHDLQEPLRVVAGYVQLLERRYKGQLDADADEFIGFAVDGANRMKRLIQDLLTYSRVGSRGHPFAPTDLQAVATRSLATLDLALHECGGTIEVGALPTVLADEVQLEQLVTNLLGNALKFAAPDRPPVVAMTSQRVDGGWEVRVSDNGIGIAPQHWDRVFRMFQRLHGVDDYPGTGIGLAIAHRIVARHGGEIWVADSAEGRGTTICFTLLDVPPTDLGASREPEPSTDKEPRR